MKKNSKTPQMMKTGFMPSLMLNMWNSVLLWKREQTLILTVTNWKIAFILDGWLHLPCGNKSSRSLINHLSQQENCNPFPPSHECSKTKDRLFFFATDRSNTLCPHSSCSVVKGKSIYSKQEVPWRNGKFGINVQVIYQQNRFRLLIMMRNM